MARPNHSMRGEAQSQVSYLQRYKPADGSTCPHLSLPSHLTLSDDPKDRDHRPDLSVSITVAGVFHAPHLAEQIHNRCYLRQLIIAHPRFFTTRFKFPRSRLRPALRPMLSSPALEKYLGRVSKHSTSPDRLDLFDTIASGMVAAQSSIVVSWSGSARKTLLTAKQRDQIAVLERGSCHILSQRNLLTEEYERTGLENGLLPDQRTIDSELAEYTLADRIMIPSKFVERSFLSQGVPPTQLGRARYGVDSSFFRPVSESVPKFVVAHVGAISARKGVHYLFQAFNELNLPNSELRLYGDMSPEIAPLMAKQGHRVVYVGRVSKAVLVKSLNEATVMALASVEEGLAMALGEAMACGRTVICSDQTGGEEFVEHGVSGYIFRTRDVESLKKYLLALYDNREHAREMGLAARQRAEELTWSAYGDQVWVNYLDLFETRQASR